VWDAVSQTLCQPWLTFISTHVQAVEESAGEMSEQHVKRLEGELAAARASIEELTSRVNHVAAEKV
jgi:hypothetical protein